MNAPAQPRTIGITAIPALALLVLVLLTLLGSGAAAQDPPEDGTPATSTPDTSTPDAGTPDAGTPDTSAGGTADPETPDVTSTPDEMPSATDATPTTTVPGQTPPTSAETTPGSQPVPCEVAMVVGCVASIQGANGEVTMTLEVGGQGQPVANASGLSVGGAQAATGTAADQEDSDRPLSDLDPWERGGLRSNFGSQSIPISHYQIGADTDGFLGVPDPLDTFVASQTNWAFTTATFLVILATNSLDWAFEFPLAEDLVGDAGVLAQTYTLDFFGFGLATSVYGLALSVTMIVAGFKAVTKGVIAAGSEVAIAFAAYVVLIVLTLTSGFGNAGLTVARLSSDISSEIASFAAGQEQQTECAEQILVPTAGAGGENVSVAGAEASTDAIEASTSSACSFGFAIQRSLIELPYQNLQWGQVLDGVPGKERCAEINLELLAEGPWGNDDEPRDRMGEESACEENANFNHQATYIRLGIASANTLAAATVTLLVLVVSAMLLWQQVKLLFLTVTMPHALVFAILPGRSRRLAWAWVEHLIGVVIRTIILALGLVVWLSLFSLIVHEQLTARGIFLSLFASVAMAISGFYGLYRLSGISSRINPVGGRVGGGRSGPATPEPGPGPTSRSVQAISGASSTLRSIRRRSASDDVGGSRVGGGPGDLPGGGVAASTARRSRPPAAVGPRGSDDGTP